jgi:hypothetical protein
MRINQLATLKKTNCKRNSKKIENVINTSEEIINSSSGKKSRQNLKI